ncbi:hexose kinase [Cytobacillus sp. Hz8]|uniref:hexose kinase n=1 Tax=Cytobacillus sp. Hz8 TaxID=3347168 RepID=UPI0035DC72F5
MIVTVTMNPSVDISYKLEDFRLNDVNRVTNVIKTAGGKGLNVARVIHLLDSPVVATGILGGTLGSYIESQLDQDGIRHDFLKTNQESRNCIAILHGGNQTEILEAGPSFSSKEKEDYLFHFRKFLKGENIITISGSLPRGLDISIYVEMLKLAQEKKIPVLLDISGELLKRVLQFKEVRPYLIKPNIDELNQLFKQNAGADDLEMLKTILSSNLFHGIEWVIVSLGSKGAFIKYRHEFFQVKIPSVPVLNPVGSGDSVVAGLAVAIQGNKSREEIMKMAMTTGVLNAMETQTGFVDKRKFDLIYPQIEVLKVDELH